MRRCYLVCYDIRDPKRLREVFKIMKGHGEPWQYSIFFCVLRPIDRVRMQCELEVPVGWDSDPTIGPIDRVRMQCALEQAMNLSLDQTMIIDLGADETLVRQSATAPRNFARGGLKRTPGRRRLRRGGGGDGGRLGTRRRR